MNPFTYLSKDSREERRALRAQESNADRAARVTANSTWWMALFTLCLLLANIGTICLLIQGGVDTHALAQASIGTAKAADAQAKAAQRFSDTAEGIKRGVSNAVEQLQAAAANAKDSVVPRKLLCD
jgi:hypothetical protein